MSHVPFQVLAKPVSAACNLSCRYCYYRNRSGREAAPRMRPRTLEAFVRQTIEASPHAPEVQFIWHGGEPTLAGIGFFREAVALQERCRPPGTRIVNALQTNGTLIDSDWTAFLAEHDFLVGVSIDGPAHFHDRLRRYAGGAASHAQALRAIDRLARADVEFNTLTVVHRLNYAHGREVYRFLRRIGTAHMQFIPLVERLRPDGGLAAPPPADAGSALAPWTPPREGFGRFLCDVFDDWLKRDVGRIFVQLFEERVASLAGLPARLCVFATDCSSTPILESNGMLYSCDHYAYPAYRLGEICETPIVEMVRGERQRGFGSAKVDRLPRICATCEFLKACYGGCPKHRFVVAGPGELENYLCPSYRGFFKHTAPALAAFANAIRVSGG